MPDRKHFPRLSHGRAKYRLRGDADETKFGDRTNGDGLSFLPVEDALMMFVVRP